MFVFLSAKGNTQLKTVFVKVEQIRVIYDMLQLIITLINHIESRELNDSAINIPRKKHPLPTTILMDCISNLTGTGRTKDLFQT